MLIGGIDSEHILGFGVTTQCPAEGFFYQKWSAPHSGPYSGKILPRTGEGGVGINTYRLPTTCSRQPEFSREVQWLRLKPKAVAQRRTVGDQGSVAKRNGSDRAR